MLWCVYYQYCFAGKYIIAFTKKQAIKKAIQLVKEDLGADLDDLLDNNYDITDLFIVEKERWRDRLALYWNDVILEYYIKDKILKKYR